MQPFINAALVSLPYERIDMCSTWVSFPNSLDTSALLLHVIVLHLPGCVCWCDYAVGLLLLHALLQASTFLPADKPSPLPAHRDGGKKIEGTAKYVDWKENEKERAMRTGVISWVEKQRKLQLLTDKDAHGVMELMMQLSFF